MIKNTFIKFLPIASVILGTFALLSFISLSIFHSYPYSMDEYNYLYQAKIFATGHLSFHFDHKLHELLEPYMQFNKDHLFSKYPPGCSLFLLLGIKLGMEGLISPLLSSFTLIFIYLIGRQLTDDFLAFITTVIIATNCYFLGYGASYFAQPAVFFLSTAALFAFINYKSTKKYPWLYLSSLALGLNILTRPLDALCMGIALVFNILFDKGSQKLKPLLILSSFCFIGTALLIGYSKILCGHWNVAPYDVFRTDFKLFYTQQNSSGSPITELLRHYFINLNTVSKTLWIRYFLPYIFWWIPLILIGFWPYKKGSFLTNGIKIISITYIFLLVVLCNIHSTPDLDWPEYGARYWYPLITPLALLLIGGLRAISSLVSRPFFLILVTSCILWQINQSIDVFKIYSKRFVAVENIQSDIDRSCSSRSIVILRDIRKFDKIEPIMRLEDFKRNPFLNGERLYAVGIENLKVIQDKFPTYSLCDYHPYVQKTLRDAD